MKDLFYRYRYLFLTMGIISIVVLSLFYNALKPEKQLPIYTPAMVNPELVDSLVQHENNKMKHTIADFSFINQNGKTITQDDYKDVIYVADFFFTTCQTICPIMTGNMAWLQDKVKDMHIRRMELMGRENIARAHHRMNSVMKTEASYTSYSQFDEMETYIDQL